MEGVYDHIQELPRDWHRAKLGDVMNVIRGASPRPKGDPKYFGGNIPWIMISDVTREKGKYISQTRDHVTEEGAKKSRHLKAGTLILSNSGTVCVPKILAVDGCIHDGFVAFPAVPERFDILYLYYFFECIRPRVIDAHRQGITQVNLNTNIVKNIQLPVAPLSEQNKLVAEIEKQFSRLDEAVANIKRVKANLKRYKAAVLKAAVEGKLTEDWRKQHPNVEPASKLLGRILAERRAKWNGRGKYKEPATTDTTNLPALPVRWVWCITDSLFIYVTSGSRGWAQHYSAEGPLFLRIGNLDHDSIRLDLKDIQRVRPPEGAEGTRTRVEEGDILVSITADVGMIAVAPRSLGEVYINQHVALARPVLGICREYLAWYLASRDGGQKHFRRLQRGATKVGLGLHDIRAVPVPLPPLAEQHCIVAEVERRLSVIEELETTVETNLTRADRLRQTILQSAFAGKLVPQGPNELMNCPSGSNSKVSSHCHSAMEKY